jgi:hypothetical protein
MQCIVHRERNAVRLIRLLKNSAIYFKSTAGIYAARSRVRYQQTRRRKTYHYFFITDIDLDNGHWRFAVTSPHSFLPSFLLNNLSCLTVL